MKILSNRNVIFGLALALGLIFPQPAVFTKHLMMPALALVMTLATISVTNDYFLNWRSMIKSSVSGLLMTYVVLGGAILAAAGLLVSDAGMWIGFVLIAAAPPAVAVIPFTTILNGNVSYTLAGTVASYLGALIVMPLFFWIFLDEGFSDPARLLWVMLLLIVLPIILSRIILYFHLQGRIAPVRGFLTDWGFFIVLYSIIAVNRDLIFEKPLLIAPAAGVALATTFVLGFVIEKVCAFVQFNPENRVSMVLLGTLKNQGIAGGLAIVLFEKEAALPSAVYTVFMILYIIWLDLRRQEKPDESHPS